MLASIALTIKSVLPQCHAKHGQQYIICAETGGNVSAYSRNQPHPGPSSARGLYGLLDATRRTYGTAENYMKHRYGSWAKAEAFHRRHGWW